MSKRVTSPRSCFHVAELQFCQHLMHWQISNSRALPGLTHAGNMNRAALTASTLGGQGVSGSFVARQAVRRIGAVIGRVNEGGKVNAGPITLSGAFILVS